MIGGCQSGFVSVSVKLCFEASVGVFSVAAWGYLFAPNIISKSKFTKTDSGFVRVTAVSPYVRTHLVKQGP